MKFAVVISLISLISVSAFSEGKNCPNISGVLQGQLNSRFFDKVIESVKIEQTECKTVAISVKAAGETDYESPTYFDMTGSLAAVRNGKATAPVEVVSGYYIGNEAILIHTSTFAGSVVSAGQDLFVIRKSSSGVSAQLVSTTTDSQEPVITGTFVEPKQ